MANTPIAPTPVGAWPTAPARTDAPATFVTRADAWVAATPTQTTAMNALATNVNFNAESAFDSAGEAASSASSALDSETAAVAAANFLGEWSALTGALAPPASVRHEGRIWTLLVSIADVTTSEPGVSSDWAVVSQYYRITRTSNTIIAVADFGQIIDITSGTFAQTFSPSSDLGNGFYCYVINSGTGVITLTPDGVETINITSVYPGDIVLILSDGSNLYAYLLNKNSKKHRVVLRVGDGFGSTNKLVRKYSSVEENVGTAITYASSAADGASFTINEPGSYEICSVDAITGTGANADIGASVNSAALTTSVVSITQSDVVAIATIHDSANVGAFNSFCRTVELEIGDVVRPHVGSRTPDSAAANALFSITKVG